MKIILQSKCAVCDSKKEIEQDASAILSNLETTLRKIPVLGGILF